MFDQEVLDVLKCPNEFDLLSENEESASDLADPRYGLSEIQESSEISNDESMPVLNCPRRLSGSVRTFSSNEDMTFLVREVLGNFRNRTKA